MDSFRETTYIDLVVDGIRILYSLSIRLVATLCGVLVGGLSQVGGAEEPDHQRSAPTTQFRSPHLRVMLDDPDMQRFISQMGLRPETFTLSIPIDVSGNLRRDHADGDLLLRNADGSIYLEFSVHLILAGNGPAKPMAYSSMLYMSAERVLTAGWSREVDRSTLVRSLRSDPPDVTPWRRLSRTTISGGAIVQGTVEVSPWQKVDYAVDGQTNTWIGLAFHDYTMPATVFEAVRKMRMDCGHASQVFGQAATEIAAVIDADRMSGILIEAVEKSLPFAEISGFVGAFEMRPARCRVSVDLEGSIKGSGRAGRVDVTLESPCQNIALSFRFPLNVDEPGPGGRDGRLQSVYVRHPILARAMASQLQRFAPLGVIGGDYRIGDIGRIMEEAGASEWEFTGDFSGPIGDDITDHGVHKFINHAIGPIYTQSKAVGSRGVLVRLVAISDGMSVFISNMEEPRMRTFERIRRWESEPGKQ